MANSGDQTSSSGRFLRPHLKTVFSKYFFLFSTFNSKMSRNMHKLSHKVGNGQNLPNEFYKKNFQSNFTYNLGHFSTHLRPHYQNRFFKIFFLCSALSSKSSRNMCILRHKLCNAKTGVSPTFTWSKEP